jgi:serine protease AprX
MKKSKLICTLVFLLSGFWGTAQDLHKVWVYFADKDLSTYDPYTFLDPKAIERRVLHQLPVMDATDAPLTKSYVLEVSSQVAEVRAESRWFNALCCMASTEQVNKISTLPYVKRVEYTPEMISHLAYANEDLGYFDTDSAQRDFMKAQVGRFGAHYFEENKIDGKGVRVAIFDAGFKSYKTNPAFEHIRKENRILKTWDFVKKKENVDGYNTHGTFVMSCVGGRIDEQNIGMATGAEFLLARTETWTEFYAEEENWLAAAEWADKNGADIINSSLGYTFHRYFRHDMDGKTSLVSKAANMAARKGILVVNSAGNEGSSDWKNIGTPADADSVLSIGGLQPKTGLHTSFSSFGPTWDKRLKPNVTAYGHVMGSGPGGIKKTQGTSFSGPLVAGFAACAKQLRPGFTNMQLFKEIEKSGDLYPYFDYAHGYGVPQAYYFFYGKYKYAKTFEWKETRTQIEIQLLDSGRAEKDIKYKDRFVQWPNYVFIHFENKKGYLDKYQVIDPELDAPYRLRELENDELEVISPLVISKMDYQKGTVLRVHYLGYTQEITIR